MSASDLTPAANPAAFVIDEGDLTASESTAPETGSPDSEDLTSGTPSTRDAALGLAAEGFYVFPLPPRQKRATMPEWQKRATNDRAQVEAFYPILTSDDLLGNTECNIGIVAGRGLLALDIDPRHGGDASLITLQKERGQLPPTRSVRTPSGGQHLYFKVPIDRHVPNSTGKLGAGLDVRGDGGYVAAPPSVTDQGAYTWENQGASIADAPTWLIELATTPRKRKETAPESSPSSSTPETNTHDLTLAQARGMLAYLHSDCSYEQWFAVCVAFRRMAKSAQDGSTLADWLDALDQWSARSSKYPGREAVEEKWLQADTRKSGYGLKYLIELAKAAGYSPPARVSDAAVFSIVPEPVEKKPPQLLLTPTGKPLSNVANAAAVLAAQEKLTLTFDEFDGNVYLQWANEDERHVLTDESVTRVQIALQHEGMTTMSEAATRAAIRMIARHHTVNCVRDWLEDLKWDGTRRLPLLMPRGFGTEASRYHIRAGRNMLLGMVARAYRPGCKVDEVIVLEGAQGSLKSTAFGIIGGAYFKELTADPRSKDFEQQLLGVWLGEFPELDAMRRADDISRIKQFITCQVDHLRLPYDRGNSDLPRRTVLCGSTNEESWLHDTTGGRRFIPVKVGAIDLQWLRDNRAQLFAEAVALFKAGRKWWVYPKEATLAAQEARAPEDPWAAKVSEYLCGRAEITELSELLTWALHVPTERQSKAVSTRLGQMLKKAGCVQLPRRRINGDLRRPWRVPDKFAKRPMLNLGPIAFSTVAAEIVRERNADLTGEGP